MVGLFSALVSIHIRLAINFYPPSLPEGTRLPGVLVGRDFVFSIFSFCIVSRLFQRFLLFHISEHLFYIYFGIVSHFTYLFL